ncbi:LysR family transcriptional regulator [Brevundimonas diminuta]|uniref:LysR family transcriptional regulator n=1 Tax=Brevundimonas diminuta TaxID=293 RepID=UPI003D9A991E
MFDWDDARIFISAARAGSLSRAARRLGMDPATVGRRVARLETSLKATLIVRSASGLQLTAAGAHFLDSAGRAEGFMVDAGQAGRPDASGGTVRISASEGFGSAILAPALPDLTEIAPDIRIELAANSGFLSPSRREVDLAVTLSAPDAARLSVQPLTNYELALYASPAYLDRCGAPATITALGEHRIVGYVSDLIYAPELRYLDEIMPGLSPALASSSIRAQREILAAGGGIGVLPCFLAGGLVRVLPDEVLLRRRFWLSAHQDVSETTRLKIVQRWLKAVCHAQRGRLSPFSQT